LAIVCEDATIVHVDGTKSKVHKPCSQEGVASYGSEKIKWLTFGSCIVRHPMLGNF